MSNSSLKTNLIRGAFAAFALTAFLGAVPQTAKADPYPWCAQYSRGGLGGASNCYFKTFAQCQATVSGVGGFCNHNPFYTGRPVVTPADTYIVRTPRPRVIYY
jgi:hypothetical protein